MSGDYSFGDEDRGWSLVLVIIRRVNVGLESIEWKSPWVEAVSGIDKVCMLNCPDQNTASVSCHLALEHCNPGTKCGLTFN